MKKYLPWLLALVLLLVITGLFLIPKRLKNPQAIVAPSRHQYAYQINTDSLDVAYDRVKSGENISAILSERIPGGDVQILVERSRDLSDLRMIRQGNRYAWISSKTDPPVPLYFVYEINAVDYLVCDLRDSLKVYPGKKRVTKAVKNVSGTIETSLWNTFAGRGLDFNLALKMADIFSWTIDFYGLQKGDHFRVIYEEMFIDSTSLGPDRVMAAVFNTDGRDHYGFYFNEGKTEGFFDEKGQSLRRSFLKAPLKFSRISSRYSKARYHPILRIFRPHFGVDYSAPRGTPVVALGDGKILSAGWAGGFGKTIKLRLNSVYTASYGHLSGFAKGIRAGVQVKQGQVIGYVGSTGLSTGPHLDFRIYKNGRPADPLKVESPPTDPVEKQRMPGFLKLAAELKAQLDSVR